MRRQPEMAGIRDLDTLASVWGERLSAREELPVTHKDAYADHAKLGAARAEGDAASMLLADAVSNHDYMNALLTDVDGRVPDGDDSEEPQDNWDLWRWQQVVRRDMAGQAEVVGIIAQHQREAPRRSRPSMRALDGIPDELLVSQAKALNMCKALPLGCFERSTDRALSKSQSRLPLTQPAAARALQPRVAPEPPELGGHEWWRADGPHSHNLFKWHAVRAQQVAAVE